MFSLFIILLNFSESLATKYLFLNVESWMVRPILIDMNPVELKYYPLRISLNKFIANYNVFISKNMCSKRNKDINVKEFNILTNKDEAKAMTEHISCGCKWKFNSTIYNLSQK